MDGQFLIVGAATGAITGEWARGASIRRSIGGVLIAGLTGDTFEIPGAFTSGTIAATGRRTISLSVAPITGRKNVGAGCMGAIGFRLAVGYEEGLTEASARGWRPSWRDRIDGWESVGTW